MVELKYKERFPGSSTGQGADPFEDIHLYAGVTETRGTLAVCPALEKWVGSELKDEFKSSEARRKAHEERVARSKAKSKKKAKGEKDDE